MEDALFYVRQVRQSVDLEKVKTIRYQVFCAEQGFDVSTDEDGKDAESVHYVGELNGRAIASGRIRYLEDYAKLERIAVLADFRGRGYGDKMLEFLVLEARRHGAKSCRLTGQKRLIKYFQRLSHCNSH